MGHDVTSRSMSEASDKPRQVDRRQRRRNSGCAKGSTMKPTMANTTSTIALKLAGF
jgi:hypothetical protein